MTLVKEWVVAGGVRSLRRRESDGKRVLLSQLRLDHDIAISSRAHDDPRARRFDSSDDAEPTLAPSERPTVSKAVVRPLTTARQFTQVQNTGYKASFARIQGVYSVKSAWKITFQWLLKLKAFKGKGAKRCARSGFGRGLRSCRGAL